MRSSMSWISAGNRFRARSRDFALLTAMLDLKWSPGEKKIARAAFDAALSREGSDIRGRVEAMLRASTDPAEIWRVRDYLNDKAREFDQKYDFRYSVLIGVFAQLLAEGWLNFEELAGLRSEKLDLLRDASARRKRSHV